MESMNMDDMSDQEVVSWLKEHLPITLIALHDISSKKRLQNRSILRSLCHRANSELALQEAVVSAAVACLAGASEGIKAGVIEFLGMCAYLFEGCDELKQRFIRIVLLLENNTPQISRSMIKFLRLVIQGVQDRNLWSECFHHFVKHILGSDLARSSCRIRVRTLIEKLGKRFGWDVLERKLPEQHLTLFRYTRRMYNRRVKKAKEQSFSTSQSSSKKDVIDSSEDEEIDSDIGSEDEEDNDEQDRSSTKQRVSSSASRGENVSKINSIKMNSDGRLVIEDDENSDDEVVNNAGRLGGDNEDSVLSFSQSLNKRVSLSDLAELRDKTNALRKAKMAEKGALTHKKDNFSIKKQKQSKRLRRQHELVGLSQFAPKKASAFGDSKKSDQDTDPYAYVRLNPSLIREKYKGNAIRSLEQVVRRTGEKAGRKKQTPGRGGVSGKLFVQKPSFKKPYMEKKKNGGKKKL